MSRSLGLLSPREMGATGLGTPQEAWVEVLLCAKFFFFLLLLFGDRVFLCSSDWPHTCHPPALVFEGWDYRHIPPFLALYQGLMG